MIYRYSSRYSVLSPKCEDCFLLIELIARVLLDAHSSYRDGTDCSVCVWVCGWGGVDSESRVSETQITFSCHCGLLLPPHTQRPRSASREAGVTGIGVFCSCFFFIQKLYSFKRNTPSITSWNIFGCSETKQQPPELKNSLSLNAKTCSSCSGHLRLAPEWVPHPNLHI